MAANETETRKKWLENEKIREMLRCCTAAAGGRKHNANANNIMYITYGSTIYLENTKKHRFYRLCEFWTKHNNTFAAVFSKASANQHNNDVMQSHT